MSILYIIAALLVIAAVISLVLSLLGIVVTGALKLLPGVFIVLAIIFLRGAVASMCMSRTNGRSASCCVPIGCRHRGPRVFHTVTKRPQGRPWSLGSYLHAR